MDEEDTHRDGSERERKGDNRPIISAIQNGLGALISRTMIVVVLPAISLIAGYAVKVTLDNISKDIAAVASSVSVLGQDVAEIKLTVKQTVAEAGTVRDSVTRLNEHAIGTDRRLDAVERHR